MVLVESSAWILVLRRQRELPAGPIATCPPVIQEVLQGAESPKHFGELRALFVSAEILDSPMPLTRYEKAAELYLRCRDAGLTIRKSMDCLIAVCALEYDIPLLHNDRDFDHIAKVVPLRAVRV